MSYSAYIVIYRSFLTRNYSNTEPCYKDVSRSVQHLRVLLDYNIMGMFLACIHVDREDGTQ